MQLRQFKEEKQGKQMSALKTIAIAAIATSSMAFATVASAQNSTNIGTDRGGVIIQHGEVKSNPKIIMDNDCIVNAGTDRGGRITIKPGCEVNVRPSGSTSAGDSEYVNKGNDRGGVVRKKN